ncbi:MAG TPA: sodium:proton antiporter [Xanthobacteraceae bacterium]|nr:sodium:proton antiporter [Xanthobacteraceae bacterium]
MIRPGIAATIVLAVAVGAGPAQAAPALDGATMAWPWALPFVGILLSIAAGPLWFRRLWHEHYGKVAAGWAALTLAAIALAAGPSTALDALLHAMLTEYLSFIVLLLALYTVAGGILVSCRVRSSPATNGILLLVGTLMASLVGTTGAAMILIRPLLRTNEGRRRNSHVVVFFIFLVANVGGALTPLGDPPLFIGFLRGVDFFWTTRHLLVPTFITAGLLLAMFVAIDWHVFRRDGGLSPADAKPAIRIGGWINVMLIAAIILTILLSAAWAPGIRFHIGSSEIELQNIVRDLGLVAIAVLSLLLTPEEHREANGFAWEPIREVAKLFAGIFVCIIPVLAMLAAGEHGSFAWLLHAVTAADGGPRDLAYFWLTGLLSALLDNAPTYLAFFQLAGGDARELMGPLHSTLAAISMGAVYMGALTYIGNAPNFMVYAIAIERGVKMPSFFGYVAWSALFMLPVLAVVGLTLIGRW